MVKGLLSKVNQVAHDSRKIMLWAYSLELTWSNQVACNDRKVV